MFGLIISSIASGQLVSRTGRYKPFIFFGFLALIVGQILITQLRVGTNDWVLNGWMFITGLGIGPTFAVFTIVVQNAVPFNQLGAATSDLTLFRQIGTTVGIAAAYTLFRLNFSWQLLREQVIGAGAPAALVPVDAPPGFDIAQLTSPSPAMALIDPLALLRRRDGLFHRVADLFERARVLDGGEVARVAALADRLDRAAQQLA